MKMQNAEMEFVTFDAQDVIATSGSLKGINLIAKGKTIKDYNNSYDPDLGNPNGGPSLADNSYFIYTPYPEYNSGKNAYKSYCDGKTKWDKVLEKSNETGYSYTEASTVQDIINWVKANLLQ